MPTIYCIGGVSGSGKTFLREQNPALARLPFFDIANIYNAYNGDISRERARVLWLDEIEGHLHDWPGESIVAEAFFAPGKLQQRGIEALANTYGLSTCYIWCAASRQQCLDRVMADYYSGRDNWERNRARVAFINEIHERYFWERDGEHAPWLLDRTCAHCRDRPYCPPECQACGDMTRAPVCDDCAERAGNAYSCAVCGRRERRRRWRQRRQQHPGGGGGGGGYDDGYGSGYGDNGYSGGGGYYGGGGGGYSGYSTSDSSDYY